VKQLCREYGLQCYTTIMQLAEKEKRLGWIKLDNVEEVRETESFSLFYIFLACISLFVVRRMLFVLCLLHFQYFLVHVVYRHVYVANYFFYLVMCR
jgi:hypothetical protein